MRLMGEVDRAGRMARVQVAIPSPLDGPGAPLLLGSYAGVELPCRPVGATFAVPRSALREGDQVWLIDDEDRLELRDVEVLMRRNEDVLVSGGVEEGERIVTSQISAAVPGLLLQAVDEEHEALAPEQDGPGLGSGAAAGEGERP